jgi:hypothetical protein
LALGLKKETADMQYHTPHPMPYPIGHKCVGLPAWSLHRLIEMALKDLFICSISFIFNDYSYDKVIELIEFQIKCGRFPKEYLEE